MKVSKVIGIILIFVALVGCDQILPEPTIDTSSDENMKQSSQKVRESLPEGEKEKFDEALQLLAFNQLDLKVLLAEGAAGVGNLENKMKESLSGKTASQVIAEAERIKLEREARQRQQALDEIKELEMARANAETAREQLKKFEVLRSRFYQEEQRYTGKQPIIEITVKNGTDTAVSRAYFEGVLASPGRSVPWHKDSFNYSISGGLEPGEEQSWRLAPNLFSDWGKVEAPADAVFTVTVEKIDGADGKTLSSTTDFKDRDRTRLAELKAKYGIQ
ncbi:DUF6694 family lipoprotein [Methylophaga pinxianii]|uniref:DUF6694 family lipoprotein n=1 Tax=Methylophaga pinxianii TaxID=2881052 RepID=UPI001CF28BE2|nr:DUF6694 family lipoprotein [Methylophaga pinxianii]MCB2426779.1 hypothetical protein [Methylophaga pinxianii]UPH46544.1 hypothetical protein LGT42_004470 [Methylophaga pinxianii]